MLDELALGLGFWLHKTCCLPIILACSIDIFRPIHIRMYNLMVLHHPVFISCNFLG